MGEINVMMERNRGEFAKGHKAWSKGKHQPQVSLRMKKLWQNPEWRERQINTRKHPNPEHSQRLKTLWQDPEYRRKQHSKKFGRRLSKEHKAKISKALRRLTLPEEELRNLYLDEVLTTIKIAKLYRVSQSTVVKRLKAYGIKLRTRSEALKGNSIGKRFRDKISEAKKGQHSSSATEFKKGFKAPKEWRDLWSKVMKEKWKDQRYVKEIMKARHARPNNPEAKLMGILDRNKFPFCYTGDGKVTIGGLCPDFTHKNGQKKVIEIFGRTFHDPAVSFKNIIPWRSQYWGRIAFYSQLGYQCLILWDDELGDEELIIEKVRGFING